MANQTTIGAIGRRLGLLALAALATSAAHAQLNVTIQNISPQQANPEGSSSNRASGGRVNRVAADPTSDDVYYAASEWGGLFKTEDRGRTWRWLENHLPQATWDVRVSPADANRIIATSFYDGKTASRSGISLSTDGGDTWTNPPTGRPDATDCTSTARFESPTAYGIAFDPDDANNVFVGTNCGLAFSTDGGDTWDYLDPTLPTITPTDIWSVIVHNGGIVDVCGGAGHYRREAGAATWTTGTGDPVGRCTLAVSPDESDVLFMTVGSSIFDSVDGGATWSTTYQQAAPGSRIPFVRVNDRGGASYDLWYGDVRLFSAACTTPADTTSTAPRCGAVATWTDQQTGAHLDVGDVAFDPTAADDACPVLFANDGGVYRNTETTSPDCHTAAWEQPDITPSALWLFDMEGFRRDDDFEAEGIYMGQQDTGAFGAEDGARQPRPDWNIPQCCDIFDVEAEATRTVFIDGWYGPPVPWQIQLDGTNFDGSDGQIATYPNGDIIDFQEMETLVNYAANSYAIVTEGTSGGIFFTTNIAAGTVTWQQLGTNAPASACALHATQQADGTPVFTAKVGGCNADGTGQLWQLIGATTTGSWTQVTRNGVSQFMVFAVDPNDEDHIIASDRSAGGTTIEMVRTVDGGANWTNLTNLDALMIGNGQFVARPPFAPIRFVGGGSYYQPSLVAISPDDSDLIVAGGHDSGVFLSQDGGTNWTLLTDPLGLDPARPHVSRPLYAHFEPVEEGRFLLYVGTRGNGVWRFTIDEEDREPIDVALVLDTSGSMDDPACTTCEDKIEVLRDAAEIFIEVWRVFSDEDDRAAVVYFDTNISNFSDGGDDLVVLGSSSAELVADIRAEGAGGGTSMGGGLQRAIDILELDDSRPRSIVLFTDGMQNVNPEVNTQADGDLEISNSVFSPPSNVSPDVPPVELTGALDIEINTIGVGSTGSFTTLLANIAGGTGAQTHVTLAPDQDLRQFFIEELVDALRDGSPQLLDYRRSATDGQGNDAQSFTINDNAKMVVFKLSWKDGRPLKTISIVRDGVDVTEAATVRQGDFYRIYSYATSAVGMPSGGVWEVRTTAREGTTYELAAIADESTFDYDFSVGQRAITAGTAIDLGATVRYAGSPVDGATVTAQIQKPQTSLQTLLSSEQFAGTTGGPAAEPGATLGQRRLARLQAGNADFTQALELEQDTVVLSPTGPGRYAAASAHTQIEGAYGIVFTIDATVNGERFVRTERQSVVVMPGEFLPADTTFGVETADTGGGFTTTIVMTPVDTFGNYLGPDRANEIDVSVLDAGATVDDVVDRGDGTYVVTIRSPNDNPNVSIRVRDDEVASGAVADLGPGTTLRQDGYYLALSLGAARFADDSSTLPAFVGAPGNATTFESQWGASFAAAIGRYVATTAAGAWRVEIEGARRTTDINSVAGRYPEGERRLTTLMVNAAFDGNPIGSLTPYLGGGVGLGFGRAEQAVFDNAATPTATVFLDGSETQLAWQLFGGVSHAIGPNTDVFFQGRYVDGGDLELATDFGKIDFEAFGVELGVRIRF